MGFATFMLLRYLNKTSYLLIALTVIIPFISQFIYLKIDLKEKNYDRKT